MLPDYELDVLEMAVVDEGERLVRDGQVMDGFRCQLGAGTLATESAAEDEWCGELLTHYGTALRSYVERHGEVLLG